MMTVEELFNCPFVNSATIIYLHAPELVGLIVGPLSYPYFIDYFLYEVDSFFWFHYGELHVFLVH